nr:uncharacterized protein LOC109176597 [Ipomoea batatas]
MEMNLMEIETLGYMHIVEGYNIFNTTIYGCYDPLQYPLLFPHGDIGWHEGIHRVSSWEHVGTTGSRQSVNINPNNIDSIDELIQAEECVFTEGRKRASMSCREYYAYKFQVQLGDKSMLLHTGRLLQQFIVDTYIKIETQRLDYFRKKQQQSHSKTYRGLVDSVETGATVGADVGHRVILPVSFIGGSHDMRRRLSMSTQEKEDREIAAEYNIQELQHPFYTVVVQLILRSKYQLMEMIIMSAILENELQKLPY